MIAYAYDTNTSNVTGGNCTTITDDSYYGGVHYAEERLRLDRLAEAEEIRQAQLKNVLKSNKAIKELRQSTRFLSRPNHSLPLPQRKQLRWIGLIQTHH